MTDYNAFLRARIMFLDSLIDSCTLRLLTSESRLDQLDWEQQLKHYQEIRAKALADVIGNTWQYDPVTDDYYLGNKTS